MLHWRDRPDLSNTEVYHTNKEVGEKVCIGSNRQQHIGWDGTTILEQKTTTEYVRNFAYMHTAGMNVVLSYLKVGLQTVLVHCHIFLSISVSCL